MAPPPRRCSALSRLTWPSICCGRFLPTSGRSCSGAFRRPRASVSPHSSNYADDTAASLADPRAITLPADASIADALEAVREATEGPREYVFVVEPPARLVGQLSASELIRRDPATRLAEAVEGSPAALSANADIRSVLSHLGWQSRSALPVVDREGRFIGAISVAELQRQFQEPRRQRTGVSTAVSLGELYWLGLAGVLDGLGSVASRSAASSSEQS